MSTATPAPELDSLQGFHEEAMQHLVEEPDFILDRHRYAYLLGEAMGYLRTLSVEVDAAARVGNYKELARLARCAREYAATMDSKI